MALVDYSDSEESETEKTSVVKAAISTSKGSFQKVVDRSNPGKIRVSLPQYGSEYNITGDGPPTKRLKTGGSALSGFNSFLPPPKRMGPATSGLKAGNAVRFSGLAAGVSLRTGDAPGFSREPESYYKKPESDAEEVDPPGGAPGVAGGLTLTPPKATDPGVKLVGKPLMFKPLSVSRKPVKVKNPVNSPAHVLASVNSSSTTVEVEAQPLRQKISLFSVSTEPSESAHITPSNEQYQPMVYGPQKGQKGDAAAMDGLMAGGYESYTQAAQHTAHVPVAPQVGAQSLNEIASDLRLSAAERRQLFGRQKGNRSGGIQSATKVINFNTDEEYKHNEELRATGEQVVHNPVRGIAPGKHSLKQLVNAAASQKEALEESFAKGKNNRAEASSRYGW